MCVCVGVFVRVNAGGGFLPTAEDTVAAAAADDITQRAPGFYVCFFLSLAPLVSFRSTRPPAARSPGLRGGFPQIPLPPYYTAYADVRVRKSIRT